MKICLVGSAPSSVRLGPYANPNWKIWACSPGAFGVVPRSDAWWEIHRWEPGQPWFSPEYVNFLKNHSGKVWMAEPIEDVKNCAVVPVEHLVKKYSPYFFTSSLAWMFAQAIEDIEKERAQEIASGAPISHSAIALFGVDMSATEEYGYQRAGCQFFALLARSKGIEVGIPPESDLLRPPPLYGICETSHAWIKNVARIREVDARLAQAHAKLSQTTQEIQFLNGSKDDMTWQMNTWFGNTDFLGKTYIEPTEVPALNALDGLTQDTLAKVYDIALG